MALRVRYYRQVFAALHGHEPRSCNICGYRGTFGAWGLPPRLDAQCPNCQSLDRHRLFKLWHDSGPPPFAGRRVLHFAPEQSLKTVIAGEAAEYVTADLAPKRADRVLDITKIDLPDESFDCVVCSHVLEHVDDAKALAELCRITRPGGFLVLMTPIVEGWPRTYESAAIVGRAERTLHFGQHNHVRFYGADFRDRVRRAGFQIAEFTAEEPFVSRHALQRGEKIFVATRIG